MDPTNLSKEHVAALRWAIRNVNALSLLPDEKRRLALARQAARLIRKGRRYKA